MQTNNTTRNDRAQPTLLERIAGGDSHAFQELVTQYGRFVVFLVRRSMSARHADFDDAVQDALLAIWRAAPHFDRQRGAEMTFIALVTRRMLIDRRRRASSRPETVGMAYEPVDQSATWNWSEQDRALSAAMDRLKPEQRELLELAVARGKTATQIAKITGLPLGTVKSATSRVLARLREDLADHRTAA